MKVPIEQHKIEIEKNMEVWHNKPLLRLVYTKLYEQIIAQMNRDLEGPVVEIGSGIGNFKTIYPQCVATDIFPSGTVDRVESAYKLSFSNNSVSHLILFDVLHHLKYPGSALEEFKRVLKPGGRVIICDPYISWLGLVVYGPLHHEPIGLLGNIFWKCPRGVDPDQEYYAAQGNSNKIFKSSSEFRRNILKDWNIVHLRKISALSYVLSGGFSRPAFYPISAYKVVRAMERILDLLPSLFATRVFVVLEKK